MNLRRTIPLIGSLAFVAGFWTACTVAWDPADEQFSCAESADCVAPNICQQGVCQLAGGVANCTDEDGDTYGVGDTAGCPSCTETGDCSEDCDDADAASNPGALEICDGKDNNCDMEIDEVLTCEAASAALDCPDEPRGYSRSCPAGTCVYKPPVQIGEECQMELACVGGMRESAPDNCF